MKTLVSAILALSLLGTAGAATAAPYDRPMHHDGFRHDIVRHAPYRHAWVRGARFEPSFARYVVVQDWRGFRLPRPAFGAHWVRVGGEFLLISNRNGRILDVVARF